MKSLEVLQLNTFHLAIRENFLFVLNIIILISDKCLTNFTCLHICNDVQENCIAILGIMPFHQLNTW